jgi:hypothetical protein
MRNCCTTCRVRVVLCVELRSAGSGVLQGAVFCRERRSAGRVLPWHA